MKRFSVLFHVFCDCRNKAVVSSRHGSRVTVLFQFHFSCACTIKTECCSYLQAPPLARCRRYSSWSYNGSACQTSVVVTTSVATGSWKMSAWHSTGHWKPITSKLTSSHLFHSFISIQPTKDHITILGYPFSHSPQWKQNKSNSVLGDSNNAVSNKKAKYCI